MTVSLEFWQLITLLLGFLATIGAFGKVLLDQFEKRLGERFAAIEVSRSEGRKLWEERLGKMEEGHRTFEREYLKFQAELPVHYVRREDYVRGQTIIEAKIDALALRWENAALKGGIR